MPSYLIECYLPLSRRRELSATATRVRRAADAVAAEGAQIRYVSSTFLPGDELCLHFLEAESVEAVSRVSGRARIAFDRVVEAIPVESSKDQEVQHVYTEDPDRAGGLRRDGGRLR
jgi:hypothetical protein